MKKRAISGSPSRIFEESCGSVDMNPRLKPYVILAEFLGEVLGKKAEIVIHDLQKDFSGTVVYIRNSLSGRKPGSPATSLILDMADRQIYTDRDFIVNYRSKRADGKYFRSSSFFIKDKSGNLIGMIGVNIDESDEAELCKTFRVFAEQFAKVACCEMPEQVETVYQENLYSHMSNIVEETMRNVLGRFEAHERKLKKHEKLEIVRRLEALGFFSMKDAISEIARIFEMSEVSIYKYIQEIRERG